MNDDALSVRQRSAAGRIAVISDNGEEGEEGKIETAVCDDVQCPGPRCFLLVNRGGQPLIQIIGSAVQNGIFEAVKDKEEAMYNHILIPTDGSKLSRMAIEHGIALAKWTNAKVTALTVTAPFQVFAIEATGDAPEEYEKHVAGLAAKALNVAKETAKTTGANCDTIRVEHEHPYRAIIDMAAQQNCDLIVMASHGRRGMSAIVLGSETMKVLTHSAVPVLVVRAPQPTLVSEQPS
jgi:nucleotide-binding universal stress UspA family protein